ncbi:MAG: hypothetical protein NZ773_03620 [Dehalococcoidia bacterium]|nr:hypothetical protein [Dehalococcoidia bacterium]
MARVPAILRPLGGPLATVPSRGEPRIRHGAVPPAPPLAWRARQWLAIAVFAFSGAALVALIAAAASSPHALDLSRTAAAAVNSLLVAGAATLFSLSAGVALALAAAAGPVELRPVALRALPLAAGVPTVVVALAVLLTVGQPSDPVLAVVAVALVQSLLLGPIVAEQLIGASAEASVAADEAARDLGARGWLRFRVVLWPVLAPALPAIAAGVFVWSLTDVVTPVLLAGPLLTLPGLIWTQARAGDSAAVAAMMIVWLSFGSVAGLAAWRHASLPRLSRPVLELLPGWSSLVLTIAMALLFPLAMAPLVLVTAAGGAIGPVIAAWPAALGGALLGAVAAAVAALGGEGRSSAFRRVSGVLRAVPAPVLAGGVVLALGEGVRSFELGSLLLLALVSLVIAVHLAASRLPSRQPLPPAAEEAAAALGAHPALIAPPIGLRRDTATALTLAAKTVGSGAAAFVVLAGLDHPVSLVLAAGEVTQRPVAAAAALSILASVAILRGVAAWVARPARLGEEP